MDDVVQLAHAAATAIEASVVAYGLAVVSKAEDQAADGTVRLGRRILESLRGKGRARHELDGAVRDLAGNPGDGDALAALRMQIRKVLANDPELIQQVRDILGESAGLGGHNAQISVERNDGIISTGSHAVNKVVGHDH